MEAKLGRRASLIVIYGVVALALTMVVVMLVLVTRDDPTSPAMAELNRAMKAAQRTGNTDSVLAIALNPAGDRSIREAAARDLSTFCVGASPECDGLEAAFVRARDNAGAAERDVMETLLSALNGWAIAQREAVIAARAQQIMDGVNHSLTAAPPAGGAAPVDAIFDFIAAATYETAPGVWRRAEPYQIGQSAPRPSPFGGLARAEMAARAGELDQIGVVRHWRVPLGQYSGDCVGTAYRAMASVYVVSLSQQSVIEAREISGGEPPGMSITINRSVGGRPPNCDADGGKPSLDGVLVLRER